MGRRRATVRRGQDAKRGFAGAGTAGGHPACDVTSGDEPQTADELAAETARVLALVEAYPERTSALLDAIFGKGKK